jgi:hypothetical protein
VLPSAAANAKRDWVKVELSGDVPVPAGLLNRAGAERIADYGAFTIAAVPRGAIAALQAQAVRENVRVRVREELDHLLLPGATVDAREGLGNPPPEKLTRSYPPGKPGLFVLQFTGPVRNEWVSELENMGWDLSRYIPHNAYIAIGAPELTGKTRQLPFVQWLDFFHPYQKAAILRRDGAVREQLFELPAGDDSAFAVEAIRAAAEGAIDVYYGSADTLVTASTSPALTKAVLIAGARSIHGGEDRTHEPSIPITMIPSQQQGFGRLSFEDILNGQQKPVVFVQSPERLFTQTGQVFRARLMPRSVSKPVKIALVWTDAPAEAFAPEPLVNDLNLEVTRVSNESTVYIGNQLYFDVLRGEESTPYSTTDPLPYDEANNVEVFRKYISTKSQFDVAVRLWNLAGDTDPQRAGLEQDFALVVLNADLVSGGQAIAPVLSAQTDAAATNTVKLQWTPASNMMIAGYDVYRGTTLANMSASSP